MVKKTTVYVDPAFFDSGEIGAKTGTYDSHFLNDTEDSVRMVLDSFVSQLEEYKKSAVEMCVMSKMTYEEAAEHISVARGIETDKKTVWRWARAGLEDLRSWLMDSPWVSPLTNGKIPVESLDKMIDILLPWEDDDGEL
jgi:hypothetical protein